jgi:hypothetical protein
VGDSKGQQETTNLEVSGRFAAIYLGLETAGVRFHTAEATGSKPVTPTIHFRKPAGVVADCSLSIMLLVPWPARNSGRGLARH